MSEYQYYEFQAIDKPLTKAQQDKVRSLSSRAEVDARSARFVYNYGDFRGDEEALMWDYYDAMLYMANWGSRHLRLRFPLAEMDVEALSEYTVGDTITVSSRNGKLLLELIFHEVDQGAWLEGEGWLPSLLELREDIRRGDLRMLYLAWLKAFHEEDGPTHDDIEPPVPAGLGEFFNPATLHESPYAMYLPVIALAAGEYIHVTRRSLKFDNYRRLLPGHETSQ